MTFQSIETVYHGATATKAARIIATNPDGLRAEISAESYNTFKAEDSHKLAAQALCDKMKWKGEIAGGGTKKGYVWVFVPDLDRLALARDVFTAAFDATETFREDNYGADLAYLLGAIIDGDYPNICAPINVDWTAEDYGGEGPPPLLPILHDKYPDDHPIWKHIILDNCAKCGRTCYAPVTDDGTGAEEGRIFAYCSQDCKERH